MGLDLGVLIINIKKIILILNSKIKIHLESRERKLIKERGGFLERKVKFLEKCLKSGQISKKEES